MGSVGNGISNKYERENNTPIGLQKWNEVLSNLSVRTHPNDVNYMLNQIDDERIIRQIDSVRGIRRNEEGYVLSGGEGTRYEDLSVDAKQKVIDLIKRYAR